MWEYSRINLCVIQDQYTNYNPNNNNPKGHEPLLKNLIRLRGGNMIFPLFIGQLESWTNSRDMPLCCTVLRWSMRSLNSLSQLQCHKRACSYVPTWLVVKSAPFLCCSKSCQICTVNCQIQQYPFFHLWFSSCPFFNSDLHQEFMH